MYLKLFETLLAKQFRMVAQNMFWAGRPEHVRGEPRSDLLQAGYPKQLQAGGIKQLQAAQNMF